MEITYQINDLESVSKLLLEQLTTKTILFYGEMGTGKTTLIKALVNALGSNDSVSSPTFSIINEYLTSNDKIYHFDLYRINDENEALNFGIEDYLYSDHWILIEWPEKLPNLLPKNADIITLTMNNNASRTLKLSKNINLTEENPMQQENLT
ncbi:tRNA (adenosine(37)-N6)-threonylcarbamoyltransferase complex ATPase subunit type 1 TsaE [Flavobacteriales bacterium 34_180_T64]|nr:tRNA (adenosine(37)-N6)-threonylcarbamoyltransferase complex ATPase subunit type 1 TsaE [Flavobacteriales bacterium 34_180_T64]